MPAKGKLMIDPIWFWGAAAVGGFILYTGQRRDVQIALASKAKRVISEINKSIFKWQLPDYAQPFGDLILLVAEEQKVDPFVLFSIGDRETQWGSAAAYKYQTGDWAPRTMALTDAKAAPSIYKVVPNSTFDQNVNGKTVKMAKVMPADGLGWGRGIAQIDWEQQRPWPQNNDWRNDYKNLTYGAKLFKGHLDFFLGNTPLGTKYAPDGKRVFIDAWWGSRLKTEPGEYVDPRPMWGEDLVSAALAAYNAGRGTALLSVAAGRPADYLTTGGNYAVDSLRRANVLASRYEANGGESVSIA